MSYNLLEDEKNIEHPEKDCRNICYISKESKVTDNNC